MGINLKDTDNTGNNAVDESEAQQYRANRMAEVNKIGKNFFYPHKFNYTCSIPDYVLKYSNLEAGEHKKNIEEKLAGRVVRIAESSTKLRFLDLVSDDKKVQIIADASNYAEGEDEYKKIMSSIGRGDIVGVIGFPGKSRRGELSVFINNIKILAPCFQMLPSEQYGFKKQELRYRKRHLDLIINSHVKNTFLVRSKVLQFLRKYLIDLNFVEVETPMMNLIPGGASARPFLTYHNSLDLNLYMRIAPELFLKRLVVGGMNRVFEIGKNFRNEGVDLTHNPEYTAIEFYMAYADYHDLISITEDMISKLVYEINGSYIVKYQKEPDLPAIEINFEPPWKKFDFIGEIEKQTGKKLFRPFDSKECIEQMKQICTENKIELPSPATATKLLDKLCGEFVESQCTDPSFIMNHPLVMSPLAKWHRDDPELSERCECFILGSEFVNFYTELNDPQTQRECFERQAQDKAEGDDEAQFMDEDYCTTLEYGLPPTAGWGLGIDRLVMFLTNKNNIKEVILFPLMRPLTN